MILSWNHSCPFGNNIKEKLTKIGQQSEEFILEDGAVLILVVQFQDFNEVMEATGILGVLGFFEDGVELINLQGSFALVALSSELTNGLEGWVQVAGTKQVSNVETVNLTVSLEVIDLKGKLDSWQNKIVMSSFMTKQSINETYPSLSEACRKMDIFIRKKHPPTCTKK